MGGVWTATAQQLVEGELVVWLPTHGSVPEIYLDSCSFEWTRLSPYVALYRVRYDTTLCPPHIALQRLRAFLPEGALVQHNRKGTFRTTYRIPSDTLYPLQWSLAIADAPLAWDTAYIAPLTPRGDTIVVAVVDAGFDTAHSDIAYWRNTQDPLGDTLDTDSNGYVNDYYGWWTADTSKSGLIPYHFHGTGVLSVISSITNNITGMAGVAWRTPAMLVAVEQITDAEVAAAYAYVLTQRRLYNTTGGQKGAFVVAVNSSFGIDYANPADHPVWCAMYDSLGREGILSVAAAPNNIVDVDRVGDVPTGCTSPFLISVTSIDQNRALQGGYGDTAIDLAAGGHYVVVSDTDGVWLLRAGTSFATPHVTGTIALMYAVACDTLWLLMDTNPAAAALTIKNWLLASVEPLSSLQGMLATAGMLNIYRAVMNAACLPLPPTGLPPLSQNYERSCTTYRLFDIYGRQVAITPPAERKAPLPAGAYIIERCGSRQLVIWLPFP